MKLMLLLLLLILMIPVASADYIIEDTNIVVFGRCHALITDGSWTEWLYIGSMEHCGIASRDVLYFYSNETGLLRLDSYSLWMRNVDGIFFWGSNQFSVRRIYPIVFIDCYVSWIKIRDDK